MSFLRRNHPPPEPDTDEEDAANIDPELRLRTVRTAASAIAESIRSEQRAEKRQSIRNKRSLFFRRNSESKQQQQQQRKNSVSSAPIPTVEGRRRNVYLNHPLNAMDSDATGEPVGSYARNKVRTTRYTIFTFLPKNLYEQFRRAANIFFLTAVVLQTIPMFGAPNPQIAALPLIFILVVTGVKDAVEDYRRATIDEEVNVSATTKLGNWRNVNVPLDGRSWYEKLLGLNQPGKVTKGVKQLREKEANEGTRIVLTRTRTNDHGEGDSGAGVSMDDPRRDGRLEDIMSVDSHSYPPNDNSRGSMTSLTATATSSGPGRKPSWDNVSYNQSNTPGSQSSTSFGVINWKKHATGAARWERTLWKKLEVGDIVLLRENDQIPADIVCLASSDPDGLCYVETKNLDGETNLKPRRVVKVTSGIASEEDIERSSFVLDSEPPHQNLYVYHGVLRFKDPQTNEDRQEPVSINELILRGCTIRNTAWVIGIVVFTGPDTKIMLNGGQTPSKQSKIEKETNFNVVANFVVLILMCAVTAVVSGILASQETTSAHFFEQGSSETDSDVINAIITFVSALIAFQNIVPVSLYITLELVKTIQAYFIGQDIDMYYAPLDAPCVPKNWGISDDLGQIEYVFSDKTGTLTQNIMEFQKCSVNGVAYGEGVTEAQRGAMTRAGEEAGDPEELANNLDRLKKEMLGTMEKSFKNRYLQSAQLTLVSPKLAEDLTARSSPQRPHIVAFFRALAVCHSVLSEKGEKNPYELMYKAESPDEAALVAAARDVGFPFVGKSKEWLDIEVMGQVERYTTLQMLEFNSTRKRMSVIVRGPDGRLTLYCKGADSVIYARLRADHDAAVKDSTAKDMEAFANSGLRTLCIAYRYLEEDEYLEWTAVYNKAVNSVEDREELIDTANEMVERDLTILGATALEDKLQVGVPEAIELLHRAGIKLWILTGDKVQTAIEIGYSCNLLKNDMDIMILQADSAESARTQIEAGLNKIASVLGPPSWDRKKRGFMPGMQASFAVVIDGDTLRFALEPELKPLFLNLGTQCETVVCCRVSPAQKALTVKLVKEGRKAMTLSIGDGANDVAMIQEANIGCGLLGLEGSQAAMSADYAFGQFRFLTKLLLVHGRWSYQRIADMHANFFYKNVIWTFVMFWYLPFNSFDATYLYQYTFILMYNLAFTSLPVGVLGAFDQDVHAKAALAFPQLYVRGIRGLEYTKTKFWMYMLDGLYQSAVAFFIPYMAWTFAHPVSWNGIPMESIADFGTTASVAAIFAANCFVGLNTHYWTALMWIVVWGSSILMVLWILVYSAAFFSYDFIDEYKILYGSVIFWTTVILAVAIALLPRYLIKAFNSAYRPLDKEIVREAWVMGDLKDRLGIEHRKARKNRPNAHELSPAIDLEATSMMRKPHARSLSEVSLNQPPGYVEVRTHSPGQSPGLGAGYRGDAGPSPPRSPGGGQDAQYLYVNQHGSPPSAGLSPGQQRSFASPSPNPSYYSASELPPPSPQPEPTYRYPGGETTTTPPPMSRRGSVASRKSNATLHQHQQQGRANPPMPIHVSPPSASSSGQGEKGVMSPTGSSYEMTLQTPTQGHQYGHQVQRSASEASFATAESYWSDDGEGRRGPSDTQWEYVSPGHGAPAHPSQHRDPYDDDDDDRATVRGAGGVRDSVASQYTARGVAL